MQSDDSKPPTMPGPVTTGPVTTGPVTTGPTTTGPITTSPVTPSSGAGPRSTDPEVLAKLEYFPAPDVLLALRTQLYAERSAAEQPKLVPQLRVTSEHGGSSTGLRDELFAGTPQMYPYTKGIVLTNDGIAYGEQVSFVVAVSGSHGQSRRTERRTRTGMRFLYDVPATSLPGGASSAAEVSQLLYDLVAERDPGHKRGP